MFLGELHTENSFKLPNRVVDAASRLGGIGFMAQNHAGSFLACKLVVLNGVSNSMHAKHAGRAANGHLVKASGFPSGCSAS
ncbi:hypothetical protein Pyn_23974 [Prunus yedoensis var. nudiflora]|uniref:Uncharacterized protein n=1 Tax=Prunus yedoensis var. nudiflora TaxID=2094558 RepID=A0A314USX5_PRUYE|nr:hypothetical protein Pyn_23974 [Prunus yedoensis var. nudiflora]